MKEFKFDKTAFKASNAGEADRDMRNHKLLTPEKRLQISTYLICSAYNMDVNNPPGMDKNIFSLRKRN
jgi:hypothetical protein